MMTSCREGQACRSGEVSMADDTYEQLARHLDEHIVGFPATPVSLKILEVLFPGDEAVVGLKMTCEAEDGGAVAGGNARGREPDRAAQLDGAPRHSLHRAEARTGAHLPAAAQHRRVLRH